VASARSADAVTIDELATRKELCTIPSIHALPKRGTGAYSPHGRMMALLFKEGDALQVKVWDATTGKARATIRNPPEIGVAGYALTFLRTARRSPPAELASAYGI
jgi:hypothetical protein